MGNTSCTAAADFLLDCPAGGEVSDPFEIRSLESTIRIARRISILYPGGGYFHSRHPMLGIGDAITELILIVMVVASLIDALQENGNGIVPPAIWGTASIIEKPISVYHSNHFVREYIPEEKAIHALGGMK